MKIYLATDHAGFEHKEHIKRVLARYQEYEVHDVGALTLNSADDYPVFMHMVASKVSEDPEDVKAIIFGGSGQGEAMVANKHSGVRAVVYYGGDEDIIKLSREHNNANVLSLGARFLTLRKAEDAVKLWLSTEFSKEERHIRRINNIDIK